MSALRSPVAALGIAALALCAGCPRPDTPSAIEIYALTAPPPSRTAQIVSSDKEHTITISRGTAIAATTWTSCSGQPVTQMDVADPDVLGARRVYRNGAANQFALWGQRIGTTTVHLHNGCAEQRYTVTVLAEP